MRAFSIVAALATAVQAVALITLHLLPTGYNPVRTGASGVRSRASSSSAATASAAWPGSAVPIARASMASTGTHASDGGPRRTSGLNEPGTRPENTAAARVDPR